MRLNVSKRMALMLLQKLLYKQKLSATYKTLCTPGCTTIIHPGVRNLYMGVYKVCTSGWRRKLLTCKINRSSMLTKDSIYKQ